MAKLYDASDVAKYFIWKANQDEQELLSNLKLQKLLYYAQGLNLSLGNGPLFHNDIEAWQYGPVVPEIYHQYKIYGRGGIMPDEQFDPNTIDEDTRDFLDEIYNIFGQFSAIRLMEISHDDECWEETEIGDIISHNSMEKSLKKYLING
jgi:uncharacterized phage-associated protein